MSKDTNIPNSHEKEGSLLSFTMISFWSQRSNLVIGIHTDFANLELS
jgi:hypothetical protein